MKKLVFQIYYFIIQLHYQMYGTEEYFATILFDTENNPHWKENIPLG